MKVLFLISLLVLSLASPINFTSLDDTLQFLQGIKNGLTYTYAGDKCSNDVQALAVDVRDIYWDFQRILGGDEMSLMALVNDIKGTMADFNITKTDCNVSELVFKIKELTSDGW